jgi:SAM-dependent methyltransferase
MREGRRDSRRRQRGQPGNEPVGPSLFRRDPGLWLLLHLRPLGDRRGDRYGRCSVCGVETRFVRNSWILPRELARVAPPGFADRESQFCGSCGSSLRTRVFADVLLEHFAGEALSIADLVHEERFRGLDVAEINSIGRMHPLLAPLPRLTYVEYPEQDLQALTYADGSFDLLLTSETLEHVPDFRRALAETRRVLRPGGRHVFTVPLDPRLERTRSRDGMAPMHHGRGGGPFSLVTRRADMLVYTDFGLDVPTLLREAGFEAEIHGSGVETVYCAIAQ